ncbi:MAG: class B sortase [Lachnospiraceae bacterium]|nr:class B sortase [Lachnospiraceae bacterium]
MARKIVCLLNEFLNMLLLSAVLLLFLYGCYGLWDSKIVYEAADKLQYEVYKPTQNQPSFEELQSRNPDVLGWLCVYGTGIDYPLVQGADNDTYLNTNVMCEYALSGSIFLDAKTQRDFSDFNSLIYGHHMEKSAMFGDVGKFLEPDYFEEHKYGSIYYAGKNHGIDFFAMLSVDAYDTGVYRPAVVGQEVQQEYLDGIWAKAVQKRHMQVTTDDRIVLLSTCDSQTTSGRHILVGKLTDDVKKNAFETDTQEGNSMINKVEQQSAGDLIRQMPKWIWAVLGFVLLIATLILWKHHKRKQRKMGDTDGDKKEQNGM